MQFQVKMLENGKNNKLREKKITEKVRSVFLVLQVVKER